MTCPEPPTVPPTASPGAAHAAALITSCRDDELVTITDSLHELKESLRHAGVQLRTVRPDEAPALQFADVRDAWHAARRAHARALAVVRVYQRAVDEELLARDAGDPPDEPEPGLTPLPNLEPSQPVDAATIRAFAETLGEASGERPAAAEGKPRLRRRIATLLRNTQRTVEEVVCVVADVARPFGGELPTHEQRLVDEAVAEIDAMVSEGVLVRSRLPGDPQAHHELLSRGTGGAP